MPDVHPDSISVLPFLSTESMSSKSVKQATLLLSKVGSDWMRACMVIRQLLPSNGALFSLKFPQSSMSATHLESLIKKLGEMNVMPKKGGLYISFSAIEKPQLIDLKKIARNILQCELYCVEESVIWKLL